MKFGYTILYVEDVEATVTFYEHAFGLQRKFVHESGYGELVTGDTALAFASTKLVESNGVKFKAVASGDVPPGFEIGLVTEDPKAAYAKAVEAGAISVKEPATKPWGQVVGYVRDLNGFLVEICSPVG